MAARRACTGSRSWSAPSLHPDPDPNNDVYCGNRTGRFFGLWRHTQPEGELRLKLLAAEPRQFHRFSDIDGALTPGERETRLCGPRERPWYEAGSASTSHTWTAICIDFRTSEPSATRCCAAVPA